MNQKNPISSKLYLAREMRKKPTKEEWKLWEELKDKQIMGVKFRRQVVLLGYIVDFYCPSYRIVIEVDGDSHKGREKYDKKRDSYLKKVDLSILRFTNKEVRFGMNKVISAIRKEIKKRDRLPFKPRPADWKRFRK